jgi:ribonuclease HI
MESVHHETLLRRATAQPGCRMGPPQAMDQRSPHYLLFAHTDTSGELPRWRVVLTAPGGAQVFEASDSEPAALGERLELLAVVRGLEALDQPSRITLVTSSRYVRRGLAYGLQEWRKNGWSWEWYGQMVPVKNRDLWQRLDGALKIHRVECRRWRLDAAHDVLDRPESQPPTSLIGQAAGQPDDVQGPASQAVAVAARAKRKSRTPGRAQMALASERPLGMSLVNRWVELAGWRLLRLAGSVSFGGAGRTAVCATE